MGGSHGLRQRADERLIIQSIGRRLQRDVPCLEIGDQYFAGALGRHIVQMVEARLDFGLVD
jgi:hypothetical protein